jgi:single-stranded-DNA-specific exonuclease
MQFSVRRRVFAESPDLSLNLHPVLRRVYAARGIGRQSDLDLSLERLAPISSLEGVEQAAHLLAAHREGRVLIVGDFDADGATSSALMVRALRAMRFAHADFLVPNRFRFGYGLTPEIVELAAAREPSLIVTVDNGISSIAGVAAAVARGIPVLVTDHHVPGSLLPAAAAIVNPNLAHSRFSSPALAGVGVAFYVLAALAKLLQPKDVRVADWLDLVAVGTVADVVALDHNNRVLVSQGLKRIRAGRCVPGIRALLLAAGRDLPSVTAADLGFAVGPRLNAAGRLDDMSIGIACLLADEPAEATRLAEQLAKLNTERREIEQRMQADALALVGDLQLQGMASEAGVCLFDESWHQGVVGLVAGRMKDRLHRPVVAFARAEAAGLRGSARSIPGIHIRDALESVATRFPELIDNFGGHAMAAGLSLKEENLHAFRLAFAEEVAARANEEILTGVLFSDGELLAEEMCLNTAQILRSAGPWGQGFPEPVFDGEFRVLDLRIVGDKHLKLQLSRDGAPGVEAIAFGYVGGVSEDAQLKPGVTLQIAYRLEVNEYRGNQRLQLNCQHFARTEC